MKNSILLPLKQLRILKGWVSLLVEMEELPDPGGPRGRSGGFGQAGSGSHHCRDISWLQLWPVGVFRLMCISRL